MLNLCAVSCIMLLLLSCAAVVKDGRQPYNDRLLAESSMMKKRLPLIERESAVLTKENLQHQMKIQELEARNKQLGDALAALNDQYDRDMATGEEQINNLQENIEKIEQENSEKIEALISQNKDLEAKMMKERGALREQIAKQKKVFNHEQEQMTKESEKKELALTTQLDDLKKQLEPKERKIASFKLAINEISVQLGAATSLAEKLKKAKEESLAELESVKAANKKAREKLLAELESLKAANKKAGDESVAKLDSVKSDNANLNKKMAELSYRLASRNNPSATNN